MIDSELFNIDGYLYSVSPLKRFKENNLIIVLHNDGNYLAKIIKHQNPYLVVSLLDDDKPIFVLKIKACKVFASNNPKVNAIFNLAAITEDGKPISKEKTYQSVTTRGHYRKYHKWGAEIANIKECLICGIKVIVSDVGVILSYYSFNSPIQKMGCSAYMEYKDKNINESKDLKIKNADGEMIISDFHIKSDFNYKDFIKSIITDYEKNRLSLLKQTKQLNDEIQESNQKIDSLQLLLQKF